MDIPMNDTGWAATIAANRALDTALQKGLRDMLYAPGGMLGRKLTEDEKAERVERRRKVIADDLAKTQDLANTLADCSDPKLRPLCELHARVVDDYWPYARCSGEDYGGYEGEDVEWPCRTAELLGEIIGGGR